MARRCKEQHTPRVLVGVIYGGRAHLFDELVCSLWDKTSLPFDLVIGCNKWDDKIGRECSPSACIADTTHNRRVFWFNSNIGHFPMANFLATRAVREGYDYFVDINDDVRIRKGDWLQEIVGQFQSDERPALVTFAECVVNTKKDLKRDENGKLFADEFASAIFAADCAFVQEHGLFDPRFHWYSGDSDLGWMTTRIYKRRISVIRPGWIVHNNKAGSTDCQFQCGRDLKFDDTQHEKIADEDNAKLTAKWKDPLNPK